MDTANKAGASGHSGGFCEQIHVSRGGYRCGCCSRRSGGSQHGGFFTRAAVCPGYLGNTPIKETVKTPRQECRDVSVTHHRPVQDENRLEGSVFGAVAGSVLVHQVSGGRGKDIATVAGALAGGYAGNQVQGHMQNNDTYTTTQQRCQTVYDKSQKVLGYDVTYKIGAQQGKIRMDRDPGTQIPLDRNGQLVLNQKA